MRKDGSIVRVTYSSAPFELPDGLGSVTAFTDVEEQRRAEEAARERDIAEARMAELRVARRRIIEAADAARAQLERDLHDGAQQQFVSALLQLRLAERKASSDPSGPASCASRPSSWPTAVSPSCAASRPGSIRRSSPTAGSARRCNRSPPGCRLPSRS